MRVVHAVEICSLDKVGMIPVDFRADPDGAWEYETLAERAGFDIRWGRMSVGALTAPYAGFPEGAAVVTLTGEGEGAEGSCSVAFVDCTAADDARARC